MRRPHRLLDRTIWSPALLDEVPPRFREIYTVLLPLKYLIFIAYGAVTFTAQTRGAIAQVTSVQLEDFWPLAVAVSALVALVGLALRRWAIEVWATSSLVALLLVYPIILTVAGLWNGNLRTVGLAIGLLVFIVAPAARIADIVRTERRRP